MELTKKDHPFVWTSDCKHALNTLINMVLNNPSLQQPDPTKPFSLQVDILTYATGTIFIQKDSQGKMEAIGFHSQPFCGDRTKLWHPQLQTICPSPGAHPLAPPPCRNCSSYASVLQLENSVKKVNTGLPSKMTFLVQRQVTQLVGHLGEFLSLCPSFKNQKRVHKVYKRKKAREQVGFYEQLS